MYNLLVLFIYLYNYIFFNKSLLSLGSSCIIDFQSGFFFSLQSLYPYISVTNI